MRAVRKYSITSQGANAMTANKLKKIRTVVDAVSKQKQLTSQLSQSLKRARKQIQKRGRFAPIQPGECTKIEFRF